MKILNEISQSQNNTHCMIPFIVSPRLVKFTETESRVVVDRVEGEICLAGTISLSQDEKNSRDDNGDGITSGMYSIHLSVHL